MTAASEIVFGNVTLARLDAIAAALLGRLPRHTVIALQGTLGAGKTRFSQSLATAAGVDAGDVTSPTFTLVQQYRGSPDREHPTGRMIYHIDAYRLADEDEFIELGGEEILEEPALILIEWPDRIAGCLPAQRLTIAIDIDESQADSATRTLRLRPGSAELWQRLEPLAAELDGQIVVDGVGVPERSPLTATPERGRDHGH